MKKVLIAIVAILVVLGGLYGYTLLQPESELSQKITNIIGMSAKPVTCSLDAEEECAEPEVNMENEEVVEEVTE